MESGSHVFGEIGGNNLRIRAEAELGTEDCSVKSAQHVCAHQNTDIIKELIAYISIVVEVFFAEEAPKVVDKRKRYW